MPKANELPDTLRVYHSHGVRLDWDGAHKEAIADCPWCGRERKFSVTVATGLWRCFVCNEGEANGKPIQGGNPLTFVRKLYELSFDATQPSAYKELAQERRLLYPDTLIEWGAAKSMLTGSWILPGYSATGKLNNIYLYLPVEGKRRLLPTATLGHQLFGVPLYKPGAEQVYLCEGPWDAMALHEVLGNSDSEGKLCARPSSRLNSASILAAPGCNIFFESWLPLFANKEVYILFDNDYPKANRATGTETLGGGILGAERVANTLAAAEAPPRSIAYACFGERGYTERLPDGCDLRDCLTLSYL